MASFTYTALRNLKTGHVAGTDYVITIDLQDESDDQPKAIKTENVALSGNVVSVLQRIEEYKQITTDYVQDGTGSPDTDDFAEFLHSVAGGELFTYNNGSSQPAILSGNASKNKQGIFYSYTFKIRLQ